MNIFITLLENVNKSRTSANNLSLIFISLARFPLMNKDSIYGLAFIEGLYSRTEGCIDFENFFF
jgi:hypothetical protein